MSDAYELVKFVDGNFELEVNVSPVEETVWLTQQQMAMLFDVDQSQISRHIATIYKEEELVKEVDRKSTRLNSSHFTTSRMPSSA